MKFLKAYSDDDDYGAMTFIDRFKGDKLELWQRVHDSENQSLTIEVEGEEICLESFQFDIDQAAYDTLSDIWADYDHQKACDIFPVEPWTKKE